MDTLADHSLPNNDIAGNRHPSMNQVSHAVRYVERIEFCHRMNIHNPREIIVKWIGLNHAQNVLQLITNLSHAVKMCLMFPIDTVTKTAIFIESKS